MRAAIAFKGPAEFHPMTIATLGKNGDQIDRLAQTAADLMIVQHCHHITPPVINMLKNYANNPRNPKRYMTIDGYDTIKILRHFGRLRLRLLEARCWPSGRRQPRDTWKRSVSTPSAPGSSGACACAGAAVLTAQARNRLRPGDRQRRRPKPENSVDIYATTWLLCDSISNVDIIAKSGHTTQSRS